MAATYWDERTAYTNRRAADITNRFGSPPLPISNTDLVKYVTHTYYPSVGRMISPQQEMAERYDPALVKWVATIQKTLEDERAAEHRKLRAAADRKRASAKRKLLASGPIVLEGAGLVYNDYDESDLVVGEQSLLRLFDHADGDIGNVRVTIEFLP